MGIYRDYNPLMESSWHKIALPSIMADRNGYRTVDFQATGQRMREIAEWGSGPIIHGRFSYRHCYGEYVFYFKNVKDILPFKLAWGGQ